jgi:hypothetical protein
VNSTNTPRLSIGENYWATERAASVLRGWQIYNAALSLTDIVGLNALETDADVLMYCTTHSITSLWYLNMNQTTSDITDKSGNGHHGTWMDVSNKPLQWTA